MSLLAELANRVQQGNDLESDVMETAIGQMMDGTPSEDEMANLLVSLAEKGESVSEIVGAARAMRSKMERIESDHPQLVDTCGTGGDGSGTFNISTVAALVAAGTGIPIAKHGNRKVSSQTGSADVLTDLGVNVAASKEVVENCLAEVGICFCFAPLFHQSVKNVGAVRQKLGRPTVFNMLGPLCNPAGAQLQLIGVGKPWQRERIAQAVLELGNERTLVVHGTDGICEISNADATDVSLSTSPPSASSGMETFQWTPGTFGLEKSNRQSILAGNPAESAELIRSVLAGDASGARDIVLMNAAAAIWLTQPDRTLEACAELAAESIDNGKASAKLEHLVEVSNR